MKYKINKYTDQSEDDFIIGARPQLFIIIVFWFAHLLGLMIILGFLYFNINSYLIGPIGLIIILFPILLLFIYLCISSTILLFCWKPIILVYRNSVRFSVIGTSIERSDVLKAVPRRSELSDDWRVDIELIKLKPRRFLICLLYPVAFALKNKIYILPLFLSSTRSEVKKSIVAALSPVLK